MKKITLEFWVKDEYDKAEVEAVMKADDLVLALYDISIEFKSIFKHGSKLSGLQDLIENTKEIKDGEGFTTTEGYEIVEKIQERYYEILEEYGIDLDKLTY